MKQVTKIFALAMLVIFASCEKNESTEDLNSETQKAELNFIDGRVVGDGEEDKELMFNEDSETIKDDAFSFSIGTESTSNASISDEIDALVATLPSQVTVSTIAKPGDNAYFNVTVDDTSGVLSGATQAWCADQDLSLSNNETVEFDVYSSYGDLPAGRFEKAENFDKVNWLINQTIVGEQSPNGLGEYNFGHVQYAMWLLIDDSVCQVCTYLSDPIGNWNADGNDVAQAQEIADLALASGDGFVPGIGELLAVVLVPEGKQSIVIGIEIEAIPCQDCQGKVTDLTLQWNWHNDYRVRVYQRYENTCYATKIFDSVVGLNGEIDLSGSNQDGSIGTWAYVFVGNCYYTKFRTDCRLNIGPGYSRGVLEVTAGVSSHGGELCEYEAPSNHCW